ncbi:PREDICTED: uncharacterized protein LOC104594146 [Nelumbo nucifera]|uniref:Uncharacterized protein LOC104594146 n=1 Tax=Nelumbo nucifera TaxID=4432 RepID=A0A1U7ZHV9_NELNU|nr:PREDICTED: uncharacterized protein LOC104594146 [Nelumbo nucifera]XP_019052744.1 PREDICTED: uncharacterized protein LOC104594146 [Nelumbo nucifera]
MNFLQRVRGLKDLFGGMDPPNVDASVPLEVKPDSTSAFVSEKRLPENDGGSVSDAQLHKKARGASGGDMKRVAEIVLVLSALGKMRGGRSPTAVEKDLMAEAREKLAEMCEAPAPKDILPSNAVRVVIEDLGLNRSRDQRLGFRPPKMSIAEKLLLTKRKMEESKEFAAQSAPYSSPLLQVGFGATTEGRSSLLQAGHRFPPEKPTHAPVTAGGFQPASTAVHVSPLSSTLSLNQLPVNKMPSTTVSRGLSTNPLEKDSSLPLPRVEVSHFRLDGRSNGSAYTSQVQANLSGDHSLDKPPTFSLHAHSAAVAKVGQVNKVPDHTPIKTEGSTTVALQAEKDQMCKPSVIQTASGNLPSAYQSSLGMNFMQTPSLYTNHGDIARNVQKFLQPRIPERPNWIPPSVDYMNKTLSCQVCKVTINDVESLLVCDACEKGVHLRCLQSYNLKGIPKGEWHCPRCLISSNGKPLPPKYGRVTRSITAPKVSSSTAGAQSSLDKRVGSSDEKINHQKVTTNGNLGLQNPANVSSTDNNHNELDFVLRMTNESETQGTDIAVNRIKSETCQAILCETVGAVSASVPCSGTANQSLNQPTQNSSSSQCDREGSMLEPKVLPKSEPGHPCQEKQSDIGFDTCYDLQASCNSKDVGKSRPLNCTEVSANHYPANNTIFKEPVMSDLKDTSGCKTSCDVRGDAQDVAQASAFGASDVGNGVRDCTRSSIDGCHSVDWVGDVLQVVDEKAFYQSCCVNGVMYKLLDHALFCSNSNNLRPSKLQALWEDTRTRSKWAIVSRCYSPSDLPEVVGRPCMPEDNEVYESNHESTVMAGLIQGPCDVLPSNKFKEEIERRTHLGDGANNGLRPVFLCKWSYDEFKGLFRPVTD